MGNFKKISRLFTKEKKRIEAPFLSMHYQLHNIARLKHLDSLGLDLRDKKVIEFGAGIGDHTFFYLLKNCDIVSTDAREELVGYIERRFGNKTMVIDIEKDISKIDNLPKFDIIHCYGLLYHLSNPEEFLKSLRGKGSLLLLETCVSSDFRDQANYLVTEDTKNPTQALSGKGSRPTRAWVFQILKEIFPNVYVPKTQPDHQEFPKNWNIDFETSDDNLKRAIFIASETTLNNESLLDYLPKSYE